jgi:hypothetical protein
VRRDVNRALLRSVEKACDLGLVDVMEALDGN